MDTDTISAALDSVNLAAADTTPLPRLLELSGERLVSFKIRDVAVTYRMRWIQGRDWMRFFAGTVIASENDDDGQTNVIDSKSPGLTLVEETLLSVEGYRMEDGRDLTAIPDWKKRLPYGHKLKASELLQECGWEEDRPSTAIVLSEFDEVQLACYWGSDKPGQMTSYSGLVHKFRPASARQQQRMARASSEAKVINTGRGRSGRTIYPGNHEVLVELYDELIVEVDGYSFNHNPVYNDRGVIIASMDTFHKVTAIQKLFAPVR